MADHSETGDKPKRSLGAELVIPVFALVFTLYYFYTIIGVPRIAQMSAFFVGSILILLIFIFVVQAITAHNNGTADFSFRTLIEPVSFVKKRLLLMALTIGYVVVVPRLGFTITTFLFLALSMLLLSDGKKVKLILSLATILSFGGFLLFIVAFKTRFPEGPFERFVGGFF